jgi:hypothetical protein
MPDTNIMLAAGPSGGKSTFVGGLYHTADKDKGIFPSYEVKVGDGKEFTDNVIDRMTTSCRYPEQTTGHYVVELDLEFGGNMTEGVSAEFIDIPGEDQERVMDEIKSDDLNPTEIRQTYREELAPKIEDDERDLQAGTGDDDIRDLYRHSYVKSDKVVFLLNLHKAFYEDDKSLVFDKGTIEKVSQERPCAVVLTGLDIISYDFGSSTDSNDKELFATVWEESPWGGSSVDHDLLEFFSRGSHLQQTPDAQSIVNHLMSNSDVDVFGISVPAENPTEEKGHIKQDGGTGFETNGFEDVIDWLRN